VSASGDPPTATRAAEISYHEPADLATVRAFVWAAAVELGLPDFRAEMLTVAVSELATNTLQHASGGGWVRIWGDAGQICCEVADHGPPRSLGRPMPAADAPRGRGLPIVERICDEVGVADGPDGTRVRLGMRL
jgi:anti-sigma regulatory factor (Ser/Thr protein kinase)